MKNNSEIILVLSNTPPGYYAGGGILLQSLIEGYGPERFCYFCTKKIYADENYEVPESLGKMSIRFAPIKIFRGKMLRILRIIPMFEELISLFLLVKRRQEVISFAKENNVGLIWATLRGESLLLVNYVVKRLRLNLVASIQDPVESEWHDKKILYLIKKKEYYKAIKRAKFIGAAGESMVQYIKKEFKKECNIQRKGVEIKKKNKRKKPFDSNKIKIGFAGSLYAVDEWQHFLSALSEFVKKNSDYKIELVYIGNRTSNYQIEGINIKYFGWSSQEQVIEKMSEMDIGYLPYKFAKKDKMQMQLSFPNKAVVYCAAEIPIFFHGPNYSSFNYFLIFYPCGISCYSNSKELIILRLEKLVFDKNFYEKCQKFCRQALEKEFTEKKMINDFKYFISKGFESHQSEHND